MAYTRKSSVQGRQWVYDQAGDEYIIRKMIKIVDLMKPTAYTKAVEHLIQELKRVNNEAEQHRWPVSPITIRDLITTRLCKYSKIPIIFIPKALRKIDKSEEISEKSCEAGYYNWTITIGDFEYEVEHAKKIEGITEHHITLRIFKGTIHSFLKTDCSQILQTKIKL